MFVRLLRQHGNHRPGRILNAPDGVANVLIRRGVAEEAQETGSASGQGTSTRQAESAPGRRRAHKER